MKPRGQLMIEHRLIEKFLRILGIELARIKKDRTADPVFIDTIVDFIKTYADRTHHGKEEDILFKELQNKKMDDENAGILRELIDEHIYARGVVKDLVAANEAYIRGAAGSIDAIVKNMSLLMDFYPKHILKEDTIFFPNTEKLFSESELHTMMQEFGEFDKKMIHEKYNALYASLSGGRLRQ